MSTRLPHIYFLLIFTTLIIKHCKADSDQVQQLKIGNLAQRGILYPLFSFGQTIAGADTVVLFESIYPHQGKNIDSFISLTGLLWGITDRMSAYVAIPAFTEKTHFNKSHGLGDLYFQLEYAIHKEYHQTRTDQITILGAITAPTGPGDTAFFDGFGAPSIFLGTTASITDIDWYLFADVAGHINFTHGNSKTGDFFLYEWGLGHNLGYLNDKVFALIVEFDGIVAKQDIVDNILDPDSGGHVIFVGPVFYFSNDKIYLQLGIQVPLFQSRPNNQADFDYRIGFSAGWVF